MGQELFVPIIVRLFVLGAPCACMVEGAVITCNMSAAGAPVVLDADALAAMVRCPVGKFLGWFLLDAVANSNPIDLFRIRDSWRSVFVAALGVAH